MQKYAQFGFFGKGSGTSFSTTFCVWYFVKKNISHVILTDQISLSDCLYHGTIIRTGITCKKIPCYMRDSTCRWCIVKKAKIFWSYVKDFWILTGVRKCRILISLCNEAFLMCPTIFLDWYNKTKLVSDLHWKNKVFY